MIAVIRKTANASGGGGARLTSRAGEVKVMKDRISLPGLVLGASTAILAALLVSHYSFAWLVVGVALGLAIGGALPRHSPAGGLSKGEQQ